MRPLACLFALLFLTLPAVAQDKKEIDLALALAIDISGSIDPDEARLQREGYVQAFSDPEIRRAILGGSNGRQLLIDCADHSFAITAVAASGNRPGRAVNPYAGVQHGHA